MRCALLEQQLEPQAFPLRFAQPAVDQRDDGRDEMHGVLTEKRANHCTSNAADSGSKKKGNYGIWRFVPRCGLLMLHHARFQVIE
ncbi:MAG: hypothetical protein KatS3mg059_0188 [Thermomicrobiales bacterium]|nr:MAG: hypothetical protein KatS3mg059_0188 [Thermomicrobiales bacterium]